MKNDDRPPESRGTDVREQLCNDGLTGPITLVQLPLERVTRLRGFFLDLDPDLLVPGNLLFTPSADPREFLGHIRPVLDLHPLARHAEVRSSGRGLHVIVWLDPPLELRTAADQRRWAAAVKVAQRTLPIDPDMPGITGVTRAVGSINSKNGAVVEVLREGQPIDPAEVETFVARVARAPFREVALPLLGGRERVSPCPLCERPGSRLDVLDRQGRCYGVCGKVTLEALLDRALLPRERQGAREAV